MAAQNTDNTVINSDSSLREGREPVLSAVEVKQSAPLTPKLRFKEFDGDWENIRLLDLVNLITKGTTPKTFASTGVNYVKIEGLVGININKDKCLYIDNEVHQKELKRSILKENDLLFAIAGATVGKVGIVTSDILPANTNQALAIIRLKDKEYLNYILQILQSRVMRKYIYQSVSVGAQPNLNLEQIGDFRFNLPSLREQQKIAAFLSTLDQKIQQLTKKKELLEDYKKGVMQQLFSQQIRFTPTLDDFEDELAQGMMIDMAANYPDWNWVGGNKLFDNISDKNHNSDLPILAITQDQGAIPREMIDYQMTVTEKSISSYKVVQVGDFVISLRTFQGGIEYSNYHGICSPAYIILRPNSDDVDRTFYKFYLKTSYYIKQLQKNLEGIRDGKMISYKYFSEIKLPFPSLSEQQKISNFLLAIDAKIEGVNQQIEKTQTFKKGLLQQMFV